ncbi:MAG: proprotein convertase P-domain-containing protein [Phycisphaerae bacterium]
MSRQFRRFTSLFFVAALCVAGSIVAWPLSSATAQPCVGLPPIDGRNLPTKFAGTMNVLQDNPTGFGDVTPPNPQPSEGNELDQMFLANDDTTLYIGLTGNTERIDNLTNTVLVFIDTGLNGGTATLATASASTCCSIHGAPGGCDDMICETCVCTAQPLCCGPMANWTQECLDLAFGACLGACPCGAADTSSALRGMDGTTLDFAPEFAIAVWNVGGIQSAVLIDLRLPANTPGTALIEGVDFAVDNSNLVGVNSEPANDPLQQTVNAATATTGFEFAISLAALGITSVDTIDVQALLVGGGGFISNQSLPPLNATVGNNGGGVNCVGNHDPAAVPPNIVDFADDAVFPGLQHVTHTLTSPGAAPGGIFDGIDIPTDFGGPASVALQNNYTCFGDAAPFTPVATNGSELDRIFVSSDADKLYIGLTGNIPSAEDTQNTILVFIDDGSGFTFETLFTGGLTGGSGALQGMDSIAMDTGFAPRWAIEYWRGGNQHNAFIEDLAFDTDIPLLFSIDTGMHLDPGVNAFSADLSNILGVNGIIGDDPLRQEALSPTAVSGVQFSFRLADLGLSPFSTIKVMACITGGTGFVSNQFLPPLNPTDPVPVLSTDTFAPALPLADMASTTNTQTLVNAAALSRVTGISVTVDITHPAVDELIIDLVHDNTGRIVRLWDGSGTGANMNTTYAEGGADLATWTAPGVGSFAPFETLLTFNDVNPTDGTWSLIIQDTLTGNTGTLNSWTLDLREDIGGAIPCLGLHDPLLNPIALNDPAFPGNQFLDISLAMAGAPTSFASQNIPVAFLPQVELALQNNHSCFGDSVEQPPASPPGSEMDQMFVTNSNDRLQLAITGNLENNRNAYILLLDTDPATGTQVIGGITSPPTPLGGNAGEPGLNGMTMDVGFAPDYGLVVHRQDNASPANDYSVFLTDLRTNVTRAVGRLVRNTGSGELLPAVPNGNGSELDELYIQNDADNLYIGLTGNLENNGNAYIIFLDTVPGFGSNFLTTNILGFPPELISLDGDILDAGFDADYAIVLDRSGNFYSAQLVDLVNTVPVSVINLTFDSVIAPNTYVGNNTNSVGVNSNPADDVDGGVPPSPQIVNAMTATTGVQFAIDRLSIGSPADLATIQVGAYLTSGGGFWSNQTLPGLGGGVANLGNPVDLSFQLGNQFTAYVIADLAGYAAPTTFDGSAIPTAMGGVALSTQDNYTQFGDAVLPPNAGNTNCMQVAFDDTNVFGVTSTDALDPGSAETGMEYDIPFADLGLTPVNMGGLGAEVKMMSVVTGGFGFLSNQFLPPLGTGVSPNLGNAGLIDMTTFPGNQFLTYVMADPAIALVDIDGDGVFNFTLDTNALVGVLLGTITDPAIVANADVNGDGTADGLDVQAYADAVLAL